LRNLVFGASLAQQIFHHLSIPSMRGNAFHNEMNPRPQLYLLRLSLPDPTLEHQGNAGMSD
jgi:hypothetical protein